MIILVVGGGRSKQNDDWKFESYKGTNLGYDMICESVNSDQEEKEGDVLNSNRIINLKNLITNIYIFLLSLGLATEVPKLTHYWVVLFHPRASAKVTSRLCPFIVLVCYVILPVYIWSSIEVVLILRPAPSR